MSAQPFPTHAARLTIDLGALAENWRLLNARAAPGKSGAVVKADCYGLGIERGVPALVAAGCDTFFVAHLSEGIRARAVAPKADIYILNGMARFDRAYWEHGLRPVLGTSHEIAEWMGARKKHAIRPGDKLLPPALHIDTGMNRLGLRLDEGLAFIASDAFRKLNPGLVMTHFVASEVEGGAITAKQIERFRDVEKAIQALGEAIPKPLLSLCNSSAHFIGAAAGYPLSRPGYALYGGNPTPGKPNPMKPVIRLEAPIVQITHVKAGETVGYSENFTATRDSRIATISVGYADGYPRNGGAKPGIPGGTALVAQRECPFVGNVSMDLITVDITDVPEAFAQIGTPVTLIGDTLDLDRVGKGAKTIGYEILTNLGRRYERVYIG
jgi:alanine racemase